MPFSEFLKSRDHFFAGEEKFTCRARDLQAKGTFVLHGAELD